MKIGIITIVRVNNYGAELQAYALQRQLALMGHDSEIIDYLHYKHPSFRYTRQARPMFEIGLKNKIKERFYPVLERLERVFSRQSQRRQERFALFHATHTRFSSATYASIDALYASPPMYDAYVVGSDQVWNPRSNVSLAPYFLTFAPTGKKTLSYGSSFGVDRLSPAAQPVFADLLGHIQHLSVRESQGKALVHALTGREATHVLDPTLLLGATEWRRVAEPSHAPRPYVLLYDLIPSQHAVALAKHWARALGDVAVTRIGGAGRIGRASGIQEARDVGPAEFVDLFDKAEAVVTNSFHGTAFAVNFRKPFLTVVPEKKTNTSRLHSFLHMVGLQDRMIGEEEALDGRADLWTLDYAAPVALLEQHRQRSMDFLESSLSAEEEDYDHGAM